ADRFSSRAGALRQPCASARSADRFSSRAGALRQPCASARSVYGSSALLEQSGINKAKQL
ncbi:MAG: hypothetical protein ACK5PB_20295, partial [Pirellula sp.]